jgi:predicted nucleotidyltransferase
VENKPTHRRVKTRAAQVCAALNAAGARYLVMGGTACALHGYLRYTRDVDILIEKSRDNVERVLAALGGLGYGFASRLTPEDILGHPITVIGDDPAVDIFWAGVDVNYRSAAPNALTVDLDGVTVPLIGLDDLIRSKRTGRAQDVADIEALEQIRKLKTES